MTRVIVRWSSALVADRNRSRGCGFRVLAVLLALLLSAGVVSPAWAGEDLAAESPEQAPTSLGSMSAQRPAPSLAQAAVPSGTQAAPVYVVCPPPARESDTAKDSSGTFGWPFWTAVGLALVGGFAAGYYFGGSADLAMPSTTFGAKRFSGGRP